GGEVVTEGGRVWRGHVGGGEKGHGCGVPTLLRNLHVWPRHVGVGIGIEAASRKRIAGAEFRGTVRISVVRHKDRNAVVGEVAVFHIGHGHGDEAGEVRPVSQGVICAEVKHLVGNNFYARGCADLVTLERRLGSALVEVYVIEEGSCIEELVSQKIVCGSIKHIV